MPSGLATYRILVDSLSLHVRLSLSDLQYNHSSALESYICVGTLPHSGHPRPCSIKSFLPSFLSWRHSCEKRYQTLSCFFVLQPAENWVGPWERGYGFLSSLCRKCVFSSLISFLSPFPTSFSSSWFIPTLPFHYPSPLPPPPPPPPSFSPFNSPFHFCSFSPTPFFNFLLSVQKNPDCLWDTFQCRKAGNVWSLWYGWGKRRWRTWSW